jgi:hypothetical protein
VSRPLTDGRAPPRSTIKGFPGHKIAIGQLDRVIAVAAQNRIHAAAAAQRVIAAKPFNQFVGGITGKGIVVFVAQVIGHDQVSPKGRESAKLG